MNDANNKNNEAIDNDEFLIFIDDTEGEVLESSIKDNDSFDSVYIQNNRWKMLIVDDEESVHNITKIVLEDFSYEGKSLDILSAYSGAEALKVMEGNPDVAIIFLDVVMENDIAGLDVAKQIRETLKNNFVRIILRTGQPGQAPERKVMVNYDINDYKLKTELTEDKLYISVISALRSYKDLIMLDQNQKGLKNILESTATLFKAQTFKDFVPTVLGQFSSLVGNEKHSALEETSGIVAEKHKDKFLVTSGIGEFSNYSNAEITEIIPKESMEDIQNTITNKSIKYLPNKFISYFEGHSGNGNLIYMKNLKDLTELDKNLIDILCANISIAFENLSLNAEIETTQNEIIFTLGEIAEARSNETGFHVKRVAEYSALLARKYGLSHQEIEMVRMATPMHDVGKLAIPDAILNKPAKLTPEEFEIIKTHSKIGYDMLKNSKRTVLQAASLIALQHHEKFNGTGYPGNLKGEQIHIYGRIAALADVFDALGSERVYKKAWELDRILELFKEEKGQHFDPTLVEIFFENLDEFLEIRDSFPDKLKLYT